MLKTIISKPFEKDNLLEQKKMEATTLEQKITASIKARQLIRTGTATGEVISTDELKEENDQQNIITMESLPELKQKFR